THKFNIKNTNLKSTAIRVIRTAVLDIFPPCSNLRVHLFTAETRRAQRWLKGFLLCALRVSAVLCARICFSREGRWKRYPVQAPAGARPPLRGPSARRQESCNRADA